VSLKTPKVVYSARERKYTAAGGDVQVPSRVTEVGTKGLVNRFVKLTQLCAWADQTSKFREVISVIFGIQVSLCVHYCKRDEVYFTTLL